MPSPNKASVERLGAVSQISSGKSDENLASTYQNRNNTEINAMSSGSSFAIDRTLNLKLLLTISVNN